MTLKQQAVWTMTTMQCHQFVTVPIDRLHRTYFLIVYVNGTQIKSNIPQLFYNEEENVF